jgi:hypothetical protein
MRTVVRMYAARRNCRGKSFDRLPAELPAMMLITNAAPNEVITMPSASVDRRVACSATGTCGEVCEKERVR